MTQFETLTDAELTQVTGGVDITFSIGNEGISLSGPLGKVSVPNPFTLVGKAISGTLGAAGELLSKLGGALTNAGQLFDFG